MAFHDALWQRTQSIDCVNHELGAEDEFDTLHLPHTAQLRAQPQQRRPTTKMDIGSTPSALFAKVVHKALSPTTRMHWIYLLSALTMALYAYWSHRKQGERRSLVSYLFPRDIWLHSSAVADYAFVALTLPLWSAWVVPQLLSAPQVAQHIVQAMQGWLGPVTKPGVPSAELALFYAATLVLAADLKLYWVHRLMHRIPTLWEFHKVHHSAEVLTPISFYRSHPVDMLLHALAEAAVTGFVTAIFLYAFPRELAPATILGVNVFRFAFYVLGANLRHSHIWLSFGPTIEHLVISPAQHQIHHSSDTRHFNRNFGSEFAVWDWVFGTLYIPRGRETLVLGLGAVENDRLRSVWQLLTGPFKALLRNNSPVLARPRRV